MTYTPKKNARRLLLVCSVIEIMCLVGACQSDDTAPAAPPAVATDKNSASGGSLGYEINGISWDGKSDLASSLFNVMGD